MTDSGGDDSAFPTAAGGGTKGQQLGGDGRETEIGDGSGGEGSESTVDDEEGACDIFLEAVSTGGLEEELLTNHAVEVGGDVPVLRTSDFSCDNANWGYRRQCERGWLFFWGGARVCCFTIYLS